MNPPLTRVMLSSALLCSTPGVVASLYVAMENRVFSSDRKALFAAIVATSILVVCGWILIWRPIVRWTPRRIALTVASLLWSTILAMAIVFVLRIKTNDDVFMLFWGLLWLPIWIASTALIWRDSQFERAVRQEAITSGHVACPRCGYDLAGLHTARCPECGTQYTLDELLSATLQFDGWDRGPERAPRGPVARAPFNPPAGRE